MYNLMTCITIDNIIKNSFLLFIFLNLMIVLFLNEISSIENNILKQFLIQLSKHIFLIVVIAIIFRNLDEMENQLPNIIGESLSVIDTIYQNFILIVVILTLCFLADKLSNIDISDKYLMYTDYIINIFVFVGIILQKGFWLNITSVVILALLKIYKYKEELNENNIKFIDKIGSFKYWSIYSIVNIIFYFVICSNYYLNRDYIFIITTFTSVMIHIMIINTLKNVNLTISLEENEINSDVKNEMSDIPIENKEQLFKTRREELNYLSYYLKNHVKKIQEPYAISINAKWGEGKTSFVNVLQKEIENDYLIINMQPMVTDTKEGLLKYFLGGLGRYFNNYGMTIECFPSIENYFRTVIKLIDKENNLEISEDSNIEDYDFRARYNDLQEKISKLVDRSGKNILIVIDDFDRIDANAKYEILTFIKEIVHFNKLKVLILMDYIKTLEDKEDIITCTFLEKFINKRFDLSILQPNDIWKYYSNLSFEIKNGINKDDKLSQELNEMLKDIYKQINLFKSQINEQRAKLEKNLEKIELENSEKNEKREKLEKQIEVFKNIESKISEKLRNARSVKRIIREVNEICDYIRYIYSRFGDEDKQILVEEINIKQIIITMILIKVIYEKDYTRIIQSGRIFKSIDSEDYDEEVYYILAQLFGIVESRYRNLNKNTKKIEVFIDNVFIANSTPEEVLNINNEYKRLLYIISKEEIYFKGIYNDDEVYKNIMNVYLTLSDNDLNKNMKNISKYLSKKLKQEKINMSNVIELICPLEDKVSFNIIITQQWAIAKNNGEYIKELKEYIKNKKYNLTYISQEKKQRDLDILENIQKIIIKLNIYNIAGNIISKEIEDKNRSEKLDILDRFYEIIDSIKEKESIEEINYILVRDIYEDKKNEDSKDCFWNFINIMDLKNKNNKFQFGFENINKELISMIDDLKNLESIKNIVKNKEVTIVENDILKMSYKELISFLKHHKNNLDTLEFEFDDFIQILIKIDKEYIEEVTCEDIKLFYKIIEPKREYIRNLYYIEIVLLIKNIEEKVLITNV